MGVVWRTSFVLVLGVCAACGDDESAVAECEALGEALCRSTAACIEREFSISGFTSTFDECLNQFRAAIACEDAGSTSRNYEACMAELSEPICRVDAQGAWYLLEPPKVCVGVIHLK